LLNAEFGDRWLQITPLLRPAPGDLGASLDAGKRVSRQAATFFRDFLPAGIAAARFCLPFSLFPDEPKTS
jgi:hypothetical protein